MLTRALAHSHIHPLTLMNTHSCTQHTRSHICAHTFVQSCTHAYKLTLTHTHTGLHTHTGHHGQGIRFPEIPEGPAHLAWCLGRERVQVGCFQPPVWAFCQGHCAPGGCPWSGALQTSTQAVGGIRTAPPGRRIPMGVGGQQRALPFTAELTSLCRVHLLALRASHSHCGPRGLDAGAQGWEPRWRTSQWGPW